MRIMKGLYDHGYEQGIRRGSPVAVKQDEENLVHHARASARENVAIPYDPDRHPEDAMRERLYRERNAEKEELLDHGRFAQARARDMNGRAAQVRFGDERPEPNVLLTNPATGILTAGFTPALHDFLPMEDEPTRWAISFIFAFMAGIFVTWSIMTCGPKGERTSASRGGLIAGFILAASTAVIRLGAARDAGDVIIGVGLTLLELGAIIALEFIARDHASAVQEWSRRKDISDEASATHGAAVDEVTRIKDRVKEIDEENAKHLAYVEDRNFRAAHAADLEESCARAVLDGYHAGVAEVAARLKGVRS
ncbi:MAG: hypothetical protein AB2A00_26800 [Myxococcota bacterium]